MGNCGSQSDRSVKDDDSYGRGGGDSTHGDPNHHPDFGLKSTHELVKFLGRGGTGDTWLFKDIKTEELVAMKLIKRPIPKVIMPNILREIRIQAELGEGHINVINAKEVILTHSHLALSLEYAACGSLTSYVADRWQHAQQTGLFLGEDQARYFFRQFIGAVEYCHQHCVAHRDLKLDNTLLDSSNPPVIKLCDFGFAKTWTADANMYTHIGTPVYMSPELINSRNGVRGYDGKSVDVWASGVLLIVMLLGTFPFDHTEHPDPNTSEAHLEVWLQQVRSRWSEIPHIRQAVEKLSKDCMDLLNRIFVIDEKKRITVAEIKQHPWYLRELSPKYRDAEDSLRRQQAATDEHMVKRKLNQVELKKRNAELQQMVEQAAVRPPAGNSLRETPLFRIDLREDRVLDTSGEAAQTAESPRPLLSQLSLIEVPVSQQNLTAAQNVQLYWIRAFNLILEHSGESCTPKAHSGVLAVLAQPRHRMSSVGTITPPDGERPEKRVNDRGTDYSYVDEALLDSNEKRYRVAFSDETDSAQLLTDVKGWVEKRKRRAKAAHANYTWFDWATCVLPMLGWLRTYKVKQNLVSDLIAGLSVAAMVVPQGMSYAKLAGLPSVYGLYGAFVPVIVYSALGSSRHLAVGPVAVTSLLLGSGLKDTINVPVQADPNNPADPQAQEVYNHAAIQVAFLAGLLYTAVGILNLGWITNFLSHSVITGFMSGAAVIIGLSQCKLIFGYNTRPKPGYVAPNPCPKKGCPKVPTISFPRHDPIQEQLHDLFGETWTPYFKWREFVMGMSWIILLLTMKTVGKRYHKLRWMRPLGPLTVTILSISIMNIFKLYRPTSNPKIRPVGHIPSGLPGATVSWFFPMQDFGKKFGLAIIVCLIDLLESISIAKAMAIKHNYKLNPTQELRALGVANLAGSFFNCYTTTGSFSRTAVTSESGGKTQLAGFTTGFSLMIVLLWVTPVFTYMPNNAQGAIIISAVIGLFNYTEWFYLWKVNKFDWIVMNAALFGVMFAGIEKGLAIAIGLSVLLVLYKVAFPHTARLGRLPNTSVYRNVKQYDEAKEIPGLLLLRIDAPLYFANVLPIRDTLDKYERIALQRGPVYYIIVDLSPVSDIDASALHMLTEWVGTCKNRGIQPVFANPARQVVRLMGVGGVPELLGGFDKDTKTSRYICVRTHDAVALCLEERAQKEKHFDDEKEVPFVAAV
ncbi:hypothetical protein WJX72_009585 [[Myrmecia] bisecta]|uniref:Sulfate transporter n=1 Tax=[Myrmecia] bisecta TaxID=41462 RepID=A0AAW1PM08_9CHLO